MCGNGSGQLNMDTIELLGVALGLATLAGLNLYMTVFVTGMAVHFQWVVLPAHLEQLRVLGNPWIFGIAGVLYFLEFFADKIPWIDSLNDAVHTGIRPLGGALIAVLALGDADPAMKVIAALIGGGAAFTSHAAKAGVRLAVNASPEPVSNIALSLGEDALVLTGLGLLALHPMVTSIVLLAVVVMIWVFLPQLLRMVRGTTWLAWRKLNAPASGDGSARRKLPPHCELSLRRAHASTAEIADAAMCLSGGGPRLPRNHVGWLVRLQNEDDALFFVAPRWRGTLVVEIRTTGVSAGRKTRFLSEQLHIPQSPSKPYVFLFERGHRKVADDFAKAVDSSLGSRSAIRPVGDSVIQNSEGSSMDTEKADPPASESKPDAPSKTGEPVPPDRKEEGTHSRP